MKRVNCGQTKFSQYLIELAKKNDKSIQCDLYKETGIGKMRLSRWFHGTHVPPIRDIPRLAKALGVSPHEMLGELISQEWGEQYCPSYTI